MTTFAFPSITPNSMQIQLVANVSRFTSEANAAVQTVSRSGEYLILSMAFSNLKTSERGEMIGFLASLRGGRHRFTLPVHCEENRGFFGGTPIINGASQVGNSVNIDGCSNNITPWISAGDVFQIGNELKICDADANSNGSGEVTVTFSPRIRTSPGDGTSVVTADAEGIFMLANDAQGFVNRPGVFSDFSIEAVEDVRA